MATIEAVATQRNGPDGRAEKYRFRTEEDIYNNTYHVLKGSAGNRPVYSTAKGFINSRDDPELIADEIVDVQKLYKKTKGIRIRGELVTVGKEELNENKLKEIKEIADRLGDYFMGRGHQTAYGIITIAYWMRRRHA